MKAPTISNKLSFSPNSSGIYPPLGFVPVADAALGNGDQFGLYWSYGREDQPPLVGDMIHDESVSFQKRYGFNADAWLDRQTGLCEQYLGDSRLTITFADEEKQWL